MWPVRFLPRRVPAAVTSESDPQVGEGEVAPARDHVVGGPAHRLRLDLVADFRSAEHDRDLRRHGLQQGDDPARLLDIPDVDAEADQARAARQDLLDRLLGAYAEDELDDLGFVAELTQVGAQAAQAERSVGVAGVEGGEDDRGHGLEGGLVRTPLTCRASDSIDSW